MKGSYILLLELPEGNGIAVGQLGVLDFSPGFYAYVGSAMGGLEGRIKRHLRQDKKLRWHIDYLLPRASISGVILFPSEQRIECSLARTLAERFPFIPGFGSSDCRCPSHLFFETDKGRLEAALAKLGHLLYPRDLGPISNPNAFAKVACQEALQNYLSQPDRGQ